MSITLSRSANFGKSKTGLATVQYSVDNGTTWVTTGITEKPAGSGIYLASLSVDPAFVGQLTWSTGEASPVYLVEDIGSGSGSVTVTQDYLGPDWFTIKNSLGTPVQGAAVTAYLQSDYATAATNAPVQGTTTTDASGHWSLSLAPAVYEIVASIGGGAEQQARQVTVR